jgi:hypothetical protein
VSYETRYAAMVRQRSDNHASSPEAAAARSRLRQAMDKARADWKAKYPEITAENIEEALEYQGERIDFWRKALNA